MLGAVVHQELMLAGRRQRAYFLRWIYAALLLAQLLPHLREVLDPGRRSAGYLSFFSEVLMLHFAVIFVITPALLAGAITDEKTRGTLAMLLTAHLRPIDIVLGKLFGRGYQIGILALTSLPLIAFFSMLGGLPLSFAPSVLAVSLVLIVGISALSLLASVWCRQTRDAVLCTYVVILGGFLIAYMAPPATRLAVLAADLDPWRAVAIDDPVEWTQRLGTFAMAWLVPAAVCLLLATWRLRPAFLRQMRSTHRVLRPWWLAWRSPMRGNPVAWRERCVNGIAPLAWMRLMPRWPAVIAVFVVSAGGFALLALRALPPGVNPWTVVETHGPIGLFAEIRQLDSSMKVACVAYHGAIALLLQVLLVATRASGCVTEERENGTWDGLLLTPISTKQIVGGKFWGIVRALLPYMAANALAILAVTAPLGGFAIVWGICSVIVSFVAVGWTAAMGIYWSSHLQSTWRSLLVTLTACFITANALALLSAILGGFLGFVVGFVVILEVALGGPPVDDAVVFATSCLVPTAIAWAGFCWLIGRETLLQGAVARINTVDRTRVARGFTRDYINWRLDRSEERRRDKIAKQTADPVQIVDDES